MQKRYLDCAASELVDISANNLLSAIKNSEGRILVSETIGSVQPILMNISNAELAASQGADLLLLNLFDVNEPKIIGLPEQPNADETIRYLQHLTGRVVGVNLEAVDPNFTHAHQDLWAIKQGRLATKENACKLVKMGAKFVTITGNPGNGISNDAICHTVKEIHDAVGDKLLIIAGKMHSAGIMPQAGKKIIEQSDIEQFVKSGVDIILLPAPGTVPGMTVEYAESLITFAHKLGALTMTAIGTSQEGADIETIKQIALMCKMAGTDLHHIGDTGYIGIALPENILAYSIVIRGRRHTYARIASSVNR